MRLQDIAEAEDPITGETQGVFDVEAWIRRILGFAVFFVALGLGKSLVNAVTGLFGHFTLGNILPGLGGVRSTGIPVASAPASPSFLGGA